jgi:hypothetical protein
MLKCESCGKAAPKNTEITETGVKTVYRLTSNPKQGEPILITSEVDYSTENEHCMLWLCKCGAENDVAADMGECSFDPKLKTSNTHSTCDDCGKTFKNGDCLEVRDLIRRVEPGSPMPTGECPLCHAFAYPSKVQP